jgi:hypothetical protein
LTVELEWNGGIWMAEQGGFTLDDGAGLRVVSARAIDQRKFDWSLF